MGNVPGKLEDGSDGSVRSRSRSNSNLSITSSNGTLNSRSRRNSNQYAANASNFTSTNSTASIGNNGNTSSNHKSLGSRRHSHTAASPIATTYNASNAGRQRRAGSLVGSLLASTQHAFGGGSSPTTTSTSLTMSSTTPNGTTPTRSRASSIFSSSNYLDNPYRKRSTRERQKFKEEHYRGLVVRFDEVVDGGYLAPYGVHDDEHKLDYNDNVVKRLIIERKLQPFYLPLDDYEPEWDDSELLKWVHSLTLHQPYSASVEKYEDLPGVEGLSVKELENSENIENYLDSCLSKTERKIQRSQIFTARLYKRKIMWQQYETDLYLNEKLKVDAEKKEKLKASQSQSQSQSYRCESWVPNDKLLLDLYRNGTECPICFLYYPGPFNISRCCEQPICTECFVQIRRKDPHYPAHENDNENNEIDEIDEEDDTNNSNNQNNENGYSNASGSTPRRRDSTATEEGADKNGTLISEPTSCPYCATPNFGVVYTPPPFYRRCGINAVLPGEYKGQNVVPSISATTITTGSAVTENSGIGSPCVSSTGVSDVILEETEEGNSAFVSQIARRGSLPAHHESVVTSDTIRPEWEVKLNKARERQKKKYLKATTIHLNNRLVSASELARMEDEMLDKAIKLSLMSNGNGAAKH